MAKKTNPPAKKTVETLTHEEAHRKNIPTAEYQSVMRKDEQSSIRVAYRVVRVHRDFDRAILKEATRNGSGDAFASHVCKFPMH